MKIKPGTRTLYLVRHAKALKADPGIADIDRPLHDTGILEAYDMATALQQGMEIPQLIISSTATRAISTATIFQRVLNLPAENVLLSDQLYEIEVNDLFELVAGLDDRFHAIMLVGHNPAFTMFSTKMDATLMHIPTAGVVRFDFVAEKWRHSSYINAEKNLFLFP